MSDGDVRVTYRKRATALSGGGAAVVTIEDLVLTVDGRQWVAINPEDREQVERLASILLGTGMECRHGVKCEWPKCLTLTLTDALREFVNPTPPKPDEPTDYLAAVVDVNGTRWARVRPTAKCKWINEFGDYADWSMVPAVRVLSPGVSDA